MSMYYIGIMSGTSLNGIDVTFCGIDKDSCNLISFLEYPFPQKLKEDIISLLSSEVSLKTIGELDVKLGELFADCINDFITIKDIKRENIEAIGLHGQTLWHEPYGVYPFSMQLGDANRVAAKTGIKTVADFRRMDIANGGEGAPFAPAFHKFLFGSLNENLAVVNIGGMANITILKDFIKGWDSGCGNVLLDMWINKIEKKAYDKDGAFARSGSIEIKLLDAMLEDDYFKRRAPKSTGREYFNEAWLNKKLLILEQYKDEDIERTLLELTAKSIANDLQNTKIDNAIICGGGAKNLFLMQRLQELCPCKVVRSEELGVNGDFLESMAFAWFAYKRVNNEIVELKSVTGASKNSLLGGVYE